MDREKLKKEVQLADSQNNLLKYIIDFVEEPENFDDREDFARLLNYLHNERKIDALKAVESLEYKSDPNNYFGVRRIFIGILPGLEANLSRILILCQNLIEQVKFDLASHELIEPLEDYLKEDEKRLIEAYDIISEDFKSYHQLIGPILATGLKENYEYFYPKIELLFNDQDERLRAISFQVLNNSKSNIKNGDHEKIKQIIVEKSQFEEDQVLATLIPLGFTLFCEFDDEKETFNKLLKSCIDNGSDITLNFLADFFAKHYSDLPIQSKKIVLSAMEDINSKHKDTIRKVDRGINKLFQSGEKESACSLLDKILVENKGDISIAEFSLTYSMLIRDRGELLSYVITRWLYSGNPILCVNANKLIAKIRGEYSISIDLSQIDLSSEKQILYLSRKVIGYLSHMPDKIIHLLFSMIKEITNQKGN